MDKHDIDRMFRPGHLPPELKGMCACLREAAHQMRLFMEKHRDDSLVQRLGTIAIHKLRESKYVCLDTIGLTLGDAPKAVPVGEEMPEKKDEAEPHSDVGVRTGNHTPLEAD